MPKMQAHLLRAMALCGIPLHRVPRLRSAWYRWGERLARLAADADGAVSLRVAGRPFRVPAGTASLRDYVLAPYEPRTTRWFRQAICPGAAVLDIGAQFGYFSIIAALQAGPAGRVVAFEPEPRNQQFFSANVRAAGVANQVTLAPVAAGAARAKIPLFAYARSDSHGMYPIPGVPVREVLEVEVVAGDEYLAGRKFDVIKIDVEGHEPAVLAGMPKTIAASQVVITELAPAFLARAGFNAADYIHRLRTLGFEVQLIDERGGRLVAPEAALQRAAAHPAWYGNLYCRKLQG